VDYFDAYNVIAYNTKLVSKDHAPKSWDDLFDPRWKSKIAMDEEMYSWYAAMAVVWGREKAERFMRALTKQDIQLRSGQSLIRRELQPIPERIPRTLSSVDLSALSNPNCGAKKKHHLRESVLQKAVKGTVRKAGISKPAM
jgi:hypothetical protein